MKRWLKAELHTHTREDPWDGDRIIHSAERLIEEVSSQGFEILAITNHDQMLVGSHLESFARQRGVLLIPGVEATLGGKHVLLYNFSQYERSWKDFDMVARHKGREQLVVAPHPFFPAATALGHDLFKWQHLFDGIEYSHFYLSWLNFNRQAEGIGRQLSLPLLGTSDAHHLFQLGRTFTRVYAEPTVCSVISAIKAGQVRLVTRPLSPFLMARWVSMSGWWMVLRLAGRVASWRAPGVDLASAASFGIPSGGKGASHHS